ncbi:MAG TPA: hypothetical protein VHY09_06075 [Candidatus Methylacidiphilales bacterium]|nr:hypothetical protein [Candidatus Methylacidiphilales bacterium]
MKAPIKHRIRSGQSAKLTAGAFAITVLGVYLATANAVAGPPEEATPAPSGAAQDTPSGTTTPMNPATLPPTVAVAVTNLDPDTTPPDYTNWATLGAGGVFVGGNNGAYKHQQNTNNGAFGGVDDFHWQEFVGKDGTFTMDGHAIFGNHDYAVKLDYTDTSLGYIRAGYTDYRIWYDGTGGFFPPVDLSFQPSNNDLYIDRRSAWVDLGLTLPDLPVFTLHYEYDSREGFMDSTSWGQTTLTPGAEQRKIVPGFLGIDETRNIFAGDIQDKIDDTTADLGLRYEIDRTDDGSYFQLSPSQPASAAITQNELERDDLFTVHGSSETEFDKYVTFSTGFEVTNVDTTLGPGQRIYGPAFDTPLSTTFPNNGAGFIDLGGYGNDKDCVGNLNLMITPVQNLVIVPALRFEYEGGEMTDNFTNTSGTGGGFTEVNEAANSNDWYTEFSQSLEARYTGFRDWSLYACADVAEDWGNDTWNSKPVLDQVNFDQDWERIHQKYTVGANWYPLPQLNFGAEYYHEISDYDYTNRLRPSLIQYPGYLRKQNFTTDDFNIRATWQALSNVSLITRYDMQFATVDTWSIPEGGTQVGGVESATYINHIIGEDLTWSPLTCLYLQVGGSYVLNTLETPVAGSAGINNLVLNGDNNYWTVDASAGYEINAKTRLQVDYSYYDAYNYQDNSSYSQPYGVGAVQNSLMVTLSRELSKTVKVSLKYGFYQGHDDTNGGQQNYNAQLVYATTEFGF